MATAAVVVPLQDVVDYIGLTDPTPTQDSVLTAFIDATLAWFEQVTGRKICGSGIVTYKENGNGRARLWLRDDPTTFTSISERDEADVKTFTAFDATDYEQDGRQLHRIANNSVSTISGGRVWPKGFRNLEVVYTAGYTASTMPKDLSLACKAIVSVFWEKRSSTGIKREKIGKYEVEFTEAAKVAEAGGIPVFGILGHWTTQVVTRGVA